MYHKKVRIFYPILFMKMNELRELLEYNVVADALGHIFNHFGDPLYDRDPNLIQ